MTIRNTQPYILLACAAIAAVVFVVDIAGLPLGVAAGVAYVPAVLLALWLPDWRHTFMVAAAVSILTMLGFALSEPAGIPWMVIANRLLALAAIWLTAIGGSWVILAKRRNAEEELRAAEQEALRARRAKVRFLETTSNDIRHHLQTLVLLNAALRRKTSDAKYDKMLSMQAEALGHLGDLMNSLLDITELESGEFEVHIAKTSVGEILQALDEEFSNQAEAKKLHLSVDSSGEYITTDGALLKRILGSLLSNAIRYTNEGEIAVRCRRADEGLHISVRDSGIGIARDQLAEIFDEFYRIDNDPVGRDGALGLGLTFVDRATALLGIKIDVESEPGRGSTFDLVIPD